MKISLRASSLPDLLDCPARWQARQIQKLDMASSGRAWLGNAFHAGTAAFDQAILDNSPISVDDAASVFVDTLRNPVEEVNWHDITPKQAEQTGLVLNIRYCEEVSPQFDFVAVELKFTSFEVDMGDGLIIELTGTTDRVYRAPEERMGVMDLKSGGRAVDADGNAVVASHKPQLGVYEALAEHVAGVEITAPGVITGLKTTGKPRIGVTPVTGAKDMLFEEGGYLDTVAMYARADVWPGNPKSMLCSKKFCPVYANCRWRG